MNCREFHDSRQRCGIAYRVKHTQVRFAPDSNSRLDRLEANYYGIHTLILTEDESKQRQSDVQSGVQNPDTFVVELENDGVVRIVLVVPFPLWAFGRFQKALQIAVHEARSETGVSKRSPLDRHWSCC